jgi:hypothetical protein
MNKHAIKFTTVQILLLKATLTADIERLEQGLSKIRQEQDNDDPIEAGNAAAFHELVVEDIKALLAAIEMQTKSFSRSLRT